MSNFPYADKYPNLSIGVIKMFQRMGQYPIDPSSVFNTVDELHEYINARGSYAYPGQIVAVANGDINIESDTDFTLYVIRTDRSIQPIDNEFLQFDSVSEAENYIQANPNSFRYGFPFVIKENDVNKIYTITKEGTVEEIVVASSGGTGGGTISPTTIKWNDIQDKPTTLSELGVEGVASTEQIQSVESLTDASYCENKFKLDTLTESLTKNFDYLMIECFSDFSSIDTSNGDSQYIIDNYFDDHCRVFRKNDDEDKVLHFNPVSFETDTNIIWSAIDWEGTGAVLMYVSTDDGTSWLEIVDKTEITCLISANKNLHIKIKLIGNVVLRNFALGVKR